MKITHETMRLIIREELNSVLLEQQNSITKGQLKNALWTFSKAANEPIMKIFNAVLNGLTRAYDVRDSWADAEGTKAEEYTSAVLKIVEYLKNIITQTIDIIKDGAQDGEINSLLELVTNALKDLPMGEIKKVLTHPPIMKYIGKEVVKKFIESFGIWGKGIVLFGKAAMFAYGVFKDTKDVIDASSKDNAFNTFADEILKADDNEETTKSFLRSMNLDDGYGKIIKEKRIVEFLKKYLESIQNQPDDFVITKLNANLAFQNYIMDTSGIRVAPQPTS